MKDQTSMHPNIIHRWRDYNSKPYYGTKEWKDVNDYHSANQTLFSCILERIVLLPTLINSVGIWSVPDDLCLFNSSIAISTSKALGSGTSGSAVFISI